ncbi:nucleotidyltransferase family protein [Luteipulveratus sp. YIM 133132]|uniref:nucleotidyltransferase family protein n=1 Tax=Luteipulveratus flavus TaxID=3031728 RepID=UPI0023AF7BE4|nr:nucleotidyltransferase family protein [Luteipulveratus sp. YIM 133132]MDE9364226.1 nucleotidyltransferase family protein [Luteipulveratus sp. YIM 133132]
MRPSIALRRHRAEAERVAARHRAVEMRVFGSVARGEDRPGSDLDLLVSFGPEASLFDQVELAQELEDLLGVRVDVVSAAAQGPRADVIRATSQPW